MAGMGKETCPKARANGMCLWINEKNKIASKEPGEAQTSGCGTVCRNMIENMTHPESNVPGF
jgi:hypothetical protein